MKKLVTSLILVILVILSTSCHHASIEDSRYPIGTNIPDGRFIAFAYEVPYKNTYLSNALVDGSISFADFIKELELIETLEDGGSKLYKYNKKGIFGKNEFFAIVCNSTDGVDDIYISTNQDSFTNICNYKYNDIENISLSIKEDTLTNTSATIIITDQCDHLNTYDNKYLIEKYDNDTWNPLKKSEDEEVPENHYIKDKNNMIEININWKDTYGKLKKGKYRIVKELGKSIEYRNHYITVEFVIK